MLSRTAYIERERLLKLGKFKRRPMSATSTTWRVALPHVWSSPLRAWVQTRERLTVRPDDNVSELEVKYAKDNQDRLEHVIFVEEGN